jgi:hypothetical protein
MQPQIRRAKHVQPRASAQAEREEDLFRPFPPWPGFALAQDVGNRVDLTAVSFNEFFVRLRGQ